MKARMAAASSSPWMTPQEAADYLRVSVDTIQRGYLTQGLRYVKVGHSTVRLRRDWVDAWMDDRTRQHIPARIKRA